MKRERTALLEDVPTLICYIQICWCPMNQTGEIQRSIALIEINIVTKH